MKNALKDKFLIALFIAIILALLFSCQAQRHALPIDALPQDTMVVKFVYDSGSHTAKIALAGQPATRRSVKAYLLARERQKQEVLAEWLQNGIPADMAQPALPAATAGPSWAWAWNVNEDYTEPQNVNEVGNYYWRPSVPVAYEGFPVAQHSFSQCGGLSDAGLYLIESQKYGPFFLKVKRYYLPAGPRFVAWQPTDGIKPDNLAYFDDLYWLQSTDFKIFKIQSE